MIKKILKNDLFIRIVALVCAIVLWFFVMAEVDPETTVEFRHIPIILEGINILEDKNLIILDGAQSDVNISLRGPISVIAKLSKENITAVVPAARVMSIVSAGLYGINFDINIENGSGVTITGKSKSQVKLTVEKVVSRAIPVEVTYEGKPAEGCSIEHIDLDPDAITVTGPESVVDTIKRASAVFPVDSMKLSEVRQLTYVLEDENGEPVESELIEIEELSITASAKLVKTADIPLTVDIIPDDHVSADMVKVEIEPASVTLSGEPKTIGLLNHINLGSINIETLLTWDLNEVILPLTLPNGVYAEDAPQQVTVKVSYPGFERAEITIPTGSFTNMDSFVYSDDSLTITVMGPETAIAGLKTANFIVTPILNDSIKTQSEARVPVSVLSRKSGVIVLGKYYVNIEKAPVIDDPVIDDGNGSGE